MDALAQISALVYDRWRRRGSSSTKICLFLGAGADISSGGLTFNAFKRQCVEDILGLHIFEVTSNAAVDNHFQQLFTQNPNPEDRARLTERIFRKMERLTPSDSYKLLVLLAEEGAIDAIVTTNFDIMLEAAQQELQRNIFQVYSPGTVRPYQVTEKLIDLPQKPYLKLHGDLNSRSVLYLTAPELENPNYTPFEPLLSHIIHTHELIIAGYSGLDPALAYLIGDSTKTSKARVFWFNKDDPDASSPLLRFLPKARLNIAKATFDDLVNQIARPVLEKPKASKFSPVYIRALFHWRAEYCNGEYLREYGERAGYSDYRTFIKRRNVEGKIFRFLQSDKVLTVLAGPSGHGKTTIGIRLYTSWQGDEARSVILIKSKSLSEPDLESYLAQQLGGLGPSAPFSLFFLEQWLKSEGVRLVLFVDAINEYSTDLAECVRLFRAIMRLAYFLPEANSAVRIIATIRQETWNTLLSRLDPIQLQQSLWSDTELDNTFNAIAVTAFSDAEVREALDRLQGVKGQPFQLEKLLPGDVERLKDPYLFNAILNSSEEPISWGGGATSIYQRVFELKLRNNGANFDPATLRECLAALALRCMAMQEDTFRPLDVHPGALDNQIVRVSKDLGILVDAEFGLLRFAHDRIQEYFLSLGLALPDAPSLERIEELEEFLLELRHNTKAMAAARMYFSLQPRSRFKIIEESIRLTAVADSTYTTKKRELLFSFSKEVLLGLAEENPSFLKDYIRDVIDAVRGGSVNLKHLRIVVQAASYLPVDVSVPLLSEVENAGHQLATTEANIYATDKLSQLWLRSGCPYIDLLVERPYVHYFGNPSMPLWRQLGRVIGLISQVGSDNTHPSEYAQFTLIVEAAIGKLCKERKWCRVDCDDLANHIRKNSDRLVFNATEESLESFFSKTDRSPFLRILDELNKGGPLTALHLESVKQFYQSIWFDLEFHAVNALWLISAMNDLEETVALWNSQVSQFSNETPAVEVDLFQSASVYIMIVFDLSYEDKFAVCEEKILSDWPDVLLYRPGLARGSRRGYHDQFDMIFEDGFGVVYPYGLLKPSIHRKSLRFRDYRDAIGGERVASHLPLYTEYLKIFLDSGRHDEAIQLLHAFSQVSLSWPMEGLAAMRDVIGHVDPVIRRAVVRILAELYNRRPNETAEFLRRNATSLSDEDLQEIKVRQDPRIGSRQIEEQQWARVLRFFLREDRGRKIFVAAVRAVFMSATIEAVIQSITNEIGL